MKNYVVFNCLILGAVLMLVGTAYAKHPAEGHPVVDFSWTENCSFPDAELSINDLTFMPEEQCPDFEALTQLEQYMLFGVQSSDLNPDNELPPYKTTIIGWVAKYYNTYGVVPEQLTPEVIRSIPGKEGMKDEWLEVERNPLTGDWPLLKAAGHSPGNFYIRVLTEEEIDYFVEHGYGYLRNPPNGENRSTPVFYVRMYGYNGVLSNALAFISNPS